MSTPPSTMENERSFLIRTMPPLAGIVSKKIAQHYITVGMEPLRLRRTGGAFELTKKRLPDPADPTRREELTIPLTRDEYFLLLPLATRGLEKTRWLLPLPSGLTAELDVFEGPLAGLVKVEVEFPDDESRTGFVAPDWFGPDISEEPWQLNANLAGKTWEEIRKDIPNVA